MAKPKTKATGPNKSKSESKGTETPKTKAKGTETPKTKAKGTENPKTEKPKKSKLDPVKVFGERKAKRLGLNN